LAVNRRVAPERSYGSPPRVVVPLRITVSPLVIVKFAIDLSFYKLFILNITILVSTTS